MGEVHDAIAQAIHADRVVYSLHAENQLASRAILRWQAVAGFDDGRLIEEQPSAKPNPKIVKRQMLPDGSPVVAVWSYVRSI
jgi:hypothetical protein